MNNYTLSPTGFQGALEGRVDTALFHVFALVIELFTLTQGDLHLDETSAAKIDPRRDQRQVLGVRQVPDLLDLFFVQEEFAGTVRLIVIDPRLEIGVDMQTIEKELFLFKPGVAVLEIDLSGAYRFDLSAAQDNPALPRVGQKVVVVRLFVGSDEL